MCVVCVRSIVRGYHVYKDDWNPSIGDIFALEIEETNQHDRYAVAVLVNEVIVGHIPREISKIVYYFIRNCGTVTGEVEDRRKRGKGLEIPCIYVFVKTLRRLFNEKAGEVMTIL